MDFSRFREERSLARSLFITLSVRVEEQAKLDSSRWETGLVRPKHVTNILK